MRKAKPRKRRATAPGAAPGAAARLEPRRRVPQWAAAALAALALIFLASQTRSTPNAAVSAAASLRMEPGGRQGRGARRDGAAAADIVAADGLPRLMTIRQVKRQVRRPGWNCTRLAGVFLRRIAAFDGHTKAIVELRPHADLLRDAASRDADADAGGRLPSLHCVPVVVKDNIAVQGMVNAAGSIVLERALSPSRKDAPAVALLRQHGALVLGRANMDEFALGFRSLSSRGGQTRNTFDASLFPGGSSGGTAVAVASGFAVIGVGTDTGGSVRIPAAFAGLVGLRPTAGLVPTAKVVPLSHTRDTVGLMAATAGDLGVALAALSSGKGKCRGASGRLRVGLLASMLPGGWLEDLYKDIEARLGDAIEVVRVGGGAAFKEQVARLSKLKSTSSYEFEEDLRAYLLQEEGLDKTLADVAAETRKLCSRVPKAQCKLLSGSLERKIHKGGKLSRKEQAAHAELLGGFHDALERATQDLLAAHGLDALAYPTFTELPSRVSAGKQAYCGNNRLAPALLWPAITVPAAIAPAAGKQLPQGLELLAPAGSECLLLRAAAAVESALALEKPRPPHVN